MTYRELQRTYTNYYKQGNGGQGVRQKRLFSWSFTAYFFLYPQIYPQTVLALTVLPGPF